MQSYPPPYNQNPWGPQPPPPPQKSNVGLIVGLLVAGFLILVIGGSAAVGFLAYRAKARAIQEKKLAIKAVEAKYWSDAASPVPVTSDDPMRGDRDALVTIVVFSDFQCPFCKRLEPTLDSLRAQYGHDLRVIWKNEPLAFHPNAQPAAEAARGVFVLGGNDAFWGFHDLAFADQAGLGESSYEAWARVEGVDATQISSGLTTHRWRAKIDEDQQLAKTLGATGTPFSFINGIRLSGAQPLEKFKQTIDDELPKARAEVSSGTPRDRVYVNRSRINFSAAPAATTTAAPAPDADPDKDKIFPVPIGKSPVRGPATALVTVVEFGDYQCPFCKRAEDSMDHLRRDYTSTIRFVWKDEPLSFHKNAEPAAELALEVRAEKGDAAYWTVHDKLYAAQPALETNDLLGIAKAMGLDENRASNAILTKKHAASITTDQKLAEAFRATGTPTFFINGRKVNGAQPYEVFTKVVDAELARARAKIASGTPQSKLYDELVGLQ